MAWIFSQAMIDKCASSPCSPEQAAESSADTCLGGAPSAPLKSTNTQQAYLSHGKTTEYSRISRFGMTFAPLTESRGEELLTLYRAGFPVRTSAWQGAEPASKMGKNPDCGVKCEESLAKFDPHTSSWKIPQLSLEEGLTSSLEILPRWGMTRNGELFRLNKPELLTGEKESGSLAKTWATPRSCSAMAAIITPENAHAKNRFQNLETQVGREKWPTPDTSSGGAKRDAVFGAKTNKNGHPVQIRLQDAVFAREITKFPTPVAHDRKHPGPSQMNRNTPTLGALAGGYLNPTWVEWLIGWPLGWTDLKPLAMDRFQEWLKLHGES
jgi:hypothetical protein